MENNQSMTLKEWIITLILIFIPIVSIIMLIIWAVDPSDKRNTFAKAYLIVSAGLIVLMIIFYVLMIVFMLGVSMFFSTL